MIGNNLAAAVIVSCQHPCEIVSISVIKLQPYDQMPKIDIFVSKSLPLYFYRNLRHSEKSPKHIQYTISLLKDDDYSAYFCF